MDECFFIHGLFALNFGGLGCKVVFEFPLQLGFWEIHCKLMFAFFFKPDVIMQSSK